MKTYQPTLASIQTHPLPDWYQDAKFGIFIHWGVYSVPAFAPRDTDYVQKLLRGEVGSEGTPYAEWYQNSLRIPGSPVRQHHRATYGPDYPYERFGEVFNQEMQSWDPESWADLFARAGARYVVLVSKHHDGFLMWPSRHPNPRLSNWGVSRDVAGELKQAVTARGLKMGFYYSSLLDWSFTQRPITDLPTLIAGSQTGRAYREYVENHWLELIERYEPHILWSDIGYPPGYPLTKLFAHFYNRQPQGVVNDRWMQLPKFLFSKPGRWLLGQALKRMDTTQVPPPPHCDFTTPEYASLDTITAHKWETCRGIGNSFGYNQMEGDGDYLGAPALVRLLVDTISKNGNLLLNVGPDARGSLHPAQAAALEGLGAWLAANAEAIYGTRPWVRFKDVGLAGGEVRYTAKAGVLYAAVTQLPPGRELVLPFRAKGEVRLLASGDVLPVEGRGENLCIWLAGDIGEDSIPVIKMSAPE